MEYHPSDIEAKWQKKWSESEHWPDKKPVYQTEPETSSKPKYYVLDMFPYPSGAGLHVGHPLGYIASDIVSRYKRAKGFNVLHPMGFDSFGLPAEQYAIETGQHPAKTTEKNIARYIEQMQKIGFSYDWDREVRTSNPDYYKWTQWIFIQLFDSWYNNETDKAEPISTLVSHFENHGTGGLKAASDENPTQFSALDWAAFDELKRSEILLQYRLAFVADTFVNWCPGLGTVLANDEVKDGFSERGGFPVERKQMRQWSLRITAYAERLRLGLDDLDWSEAVKEMQRNWIGRSQGASLWFDVQGFDDKIEVFTTRIDTTFGVTFLSLAPEHPLVEKITTSGQKNEVEAYLKATQSKSERDRMADVKTISGAFTGAFATNPFNGKRIQIWIADYVLAGYGTGAVMAVPSSDTRDYAFAKHFDLPIIPVQEGEKTDISQDDFDPKAGTMINSGFLNGLPVKEAIAKATSWAEEKGIGKGKVNYRMRDAIFGRQRYWGEPVPVYYENGVANTLPVSELPLILPEIDEYKPTETGEPPLGRAKDWKYKDQFDYELSTMPGWAGSSWYFLRYMDPKNVGEPFSKAAEAYWQSVDLYIGGTEHATGHLLYSRFWHKFLKDRGFVTTEEPFQKLVNQGMIQGVSAKMQIATFFSNEETPRHRNIILPNNDFVSNLPETNTRCRIGNYPSKYVTFKYLEGNSQATTDIHRFEAAVIEFPYLDSLEYPNEENLTKFILSDLGLPRNFQYTQLIDTRLEMMRSWLTSENQVVSFNPEVEKMSKSKYNVVNPDDICKEYGADTLRLYEMFLGPLEQSKPWNTNGIEGVFRFLRKLWRLFIGENGYLLLSTEPPTKAELKILHRTIRKTQEDIEALSLNTSVSSFMVCVNELSSFKCNKKEILIPLLIVMAPYAPHICEELWHLSGQEGSVTKASFPVFNPDFLIEDEFEYPISINGKVRTKATFAADMPTQDIENQILAMEEVQKWLEGKSPKKVIVVPKRIVNVVV